MASFMLAAVLMCLISTASAYDFYVGGQAGWVENPKESYNNWAGRMRFQVNDKLGMHQNSLSPVSIFNSQHADDVLLFVESNFFLNLQCLSTRKQGTPFL